MKKIPSEAYPPATGSEDRRKEGISATPEGVVSFSIFFSGTIYPE